jgi:hypothetical protein
MKKLFCRISLFMLACACVAFTQEKPPQWPMFRKHALDAGANEAAAVADINRDGRLDIVAGENWYEAPDWKKHRLREIGFQNGYVDDFSNHALDVNGDSFPDIVACSWFSKQLRWFENPRRFDGELANVLWKERVIETGFNYELSLLADVDGDGKAQELLPNYGSSNEVAWFEVVKGQFVRHAVGRVPNVRGLHGIGAGDLSGDGKPDILTAHGWFEAPADARAGAWTWRDDARADKITRQCSPLFAQDVNNDGRRDLVFGSAHAFGLYWLGNRGSGQWREHTIDDSWSQAHAFHLVDLDRDGRLDIVTGKRYLAHDIDPGAYEPLGLYWYRLNADGTHTKHVIDYNTKTGGGMQIPVVDIDGDGDLDLVAPGKSGLYLFEQVNPPRQKEK